MDDPLIGQTVDGRYTVESRIARGGMATVYRAVDARLGRRVALKVLHPHLAEDPGFAQRFVQEAHAAARLSHPHVVSVFDQGQVGGLLYLVLELVEGQTLRAALGVRDVLTPREMFAVLTPVTEGLAAAHAGGVVHRDVKPENILLGDGGQVKLADFGLARAVSASHTAGPSLGTAAYMAPELVSDGRAGVYSDVYALGVLMFELLTGEQPLTAPTPMQVAVRHLHEDVPAPSTLVPGLSPELDHLVLDATARDPQRRLPDAAALLVRLQTARAGLTAAELDLRPGQGAGGASYAATEVLAPTPTLSAAAAAMSSTRVMPPVPQVPSRASRADAADPTVAYGAGPGSPTQAYGAGVGPDALTQAYGAPPALGASGPGAPGLGVSGPGGPGGPGPGVAGSEAGGAASADAAGSAASRRARRLREQITGPPIGDQGPVGGVDDMMAVRDEVPADLARLAEQRRRRGLIALAAVVVAALLVIIMTWWFAAGPGSAVNVPSVTNMTYDQAATALDDADLKATKAFVHSDDVDKDKVVGTTPTAGTSVLKGAMITVLVSDGPTKVKVPKTAKLTPEAATKKLEASYLTVAQDQTQVYSDSVDKGDVVGTTPASGKSVANGTTVTLRVSKGPKPLTVPNVVGQEQSSATQTLQNAGFTVTVTQQSDDTVTAGVVISQSPEADSTGTKGDTVTLTVSTGPEQQTVTQFSMPKVTDMDVDDAKQQLEALGLQVRVVGNNDGTVHQQNPGEGQTVQTGQSVVLVAW